jgi:uncharacterized protein Yka (UPF0111/DUF47 family)
MANKFDYYDAFQDQADYLLKATNSLAELMNNYDRGLLVETLDQIHALETEADGVNLQVRNHLHIDLLTPIDRSDISRLTLALDDSVDNVDELTRCFYMYHCESVNESMVSLLGCLTRSVHALVEALALMPKMKKKHDKLLKKLDKVRAAEDHCDGLCVRAIYELFDNGEEVLTKERFAKLMVYRGFRDALTSVELCSSIIEEVMITNS